jgi:hypothetical protein
LGAIVRPRTIAAAVVIAVALVVAVPSLAGGQETPGGSTTTTMQATTTTTEATTTTTVPPEGEPECEPSYLPDLCIPPGLPDINCDDIPEITDFPVLPPDPHGFDGDNDGIGCESGGEARPAPAPPAAPVTGEPDFTG